MQTKSFLILETWGRTQASYYDYTTLKAKIRKGILAEDISDTFNVVDEWTPGDKERIYFFPGCSVPRFKVREKWSVTIKPEYATSAFISTSGLDDNSWITKSKYVMVEASHILKFYQANYGKDAYQTVKISSILMNCEEHVLIAEKEFERIYRKAPSDSTGPEPKTLNDITNPNIDYTVYSNYINNQQMFYILDVANATMPNCNIYNENTILKVLNEDRVTITEKLYENLRLMGQSKDPENVILLMETMANSNFEKSFLYLLLLLQEFQPKFKEQHKAASTVNFRSLLTYLELTPKDVKNKFRIDHLASIMRNHNQFTRSNIQRLTQHFGDNAVKGSTLFKAGPVLKPEMNEYLDQDVVSDADEIELEDKI